MVKTAETPFKAVSYEDAKDRVRLEMAFKYANDEIEKIKQDSMTKCKKYFVNILTIWYNYFVKKIIWR